MSYAGERPPPTLDGGRSIRDLHDRLADGRTTVRSLVEETVARCAELDPAIGAYEVLDADGAFAQADALDRSLRDGAPVRSLTGVTLAVKDMIDVRGLPTRAGSAVLADAPDAEADAPVVESLRGKGVVVMGKTTTHEFAMGTVTPQTRNPHDAARIAGGSSGGSAAAVAAGLSAAALGTDTGGSIRIPSALCGVVGLKPRAGLLDVSGIIPLSPVADVAGPIARTVDDVRTIWRALAGHTSASPVITRIGVPVAGAVGELAPDVDDAYRRARHRLRQRGIEVVTIQVPDFDAWYPVRLVPLYAAASRIHGARGWFPDRRDGYSPGLRSVLDIGAGQTTDDVLDAWSELTSLCGRMLEALDAVDAMLLPTTPISAPRRTIDVDGAPRDGLTDVSRTLTRLCAPFNWMPLAAVSVPVDSGTGSLPIGMQLIARDELTALAAAELVESHHHFSDTLTQGTLR